VGKRSLGLDPNPSGTYASKPSGTATTGYVPTAQSDGTVAWAPPSGGGGGGIALDTDGVPYVTS
jgi:hypothetical protein